MSGECFASFVAPGRCSKVFFISKTVVNIHAHQLQNRRFGLGLNDIYFLSSCRANTYLSVVVTIIFTDFYTHTCLHTTILCSCFTTHSKKSKTMTGNTRFSYKACELAHIRFNERHKIRADTQAQGRKYKLFGP